MTIYFGNYSQFKNTSPWYCYEIAKQNFLQKVKLSILNPSPQSCNNFSIAFQVRKNMYLQSFLGFLSRFINAMENKMIETAVFEKSACKSLIMDLIDKGGFETGKFVARFDSV